MYFLETHSKNPYYNLAFEEYFFTNFPGVSFFSLWQNSDSIIIGNNQIAENEINVDYVTEHNISVVRRITGGGAVFHDLGNINFSIIQDFDSLENISFESIAEPIISTLKDLGIDAYAKGRNDILVDGKKISGTAQRSKGNRVLFHGTILYEANIDKMSACLNVDKEKYESKSTKSVRARTANIKDLYGYDYTSAEFFDLLKSIFLKRLDVYKLNSHDTSEIEKLMNAQYLDRNWTFGNNPPYNFCNKKHYDCGIIEVHLKIVHDKVEFCKFYGDYIANKDSDDLAKSIIGLDYTKVSIESALKHIKVSDYFDNITSGELVELLII